MRIRGPKTKCGRKPIIVMDYKQLGTDMDEDADEMKLTMVVMRDQSTWNGSESHLRAKGER